MKQKSCERENHLGPQIARKGGETWRLKTRCTCQLCRPSGTRLLNVSLPGTNVPGYRLYRPCGTAPVAAVLTWMKYKSCKPRNHCEPPIARKKMRPACPTETVPQGRNNL
jgi:hypothetical protein